VSYSLDHRLPHSVNVPAGIQTAAVAGWWPRLFLLAAILLAVWLGTLSFTAVPAAVPAGAPAASFSAGRALQDLAVVAAVPHPIGSPANAAVRDYLLGEIAKLGLEAQVQRTTVSELSPLSGSAQVTPVENIVVRLPGTRGSGKAVLLTAHYDSVPTTPGAGDCGSCTVAVLETLRATKAGPPLQNDVIFLFTDGEELGVVGATAFAREHPWAQDVGLSLVLEGLGTQGSALLYAVGPNHGGVVREAFSVMAAPGGFAYLNDVMWKLSGNSGSDLDAFVANGTPGLAFVHLTLDGSPSYHSGADNVQALDPGTLQQHGDQALSLVRHFGNRDLTGFAGEPDAVFFSLLPGVVVHYPGALALPLAAVAALLAAAAVIVGWRRRAFSLLGLLGGVVAVFVGLLVVLVAGTGIWWLLRLGNPNLHMYSVGGWYGAVWTTAGLVLLSLAVLAALQALWRLRLGIGALTAAGLLWFAGLALLTATSLPGFGYIFALPLIPAALAAACCWWNGPLVRRPWIHAAVLAVPAFVAVLLVTPVVYGLVIFAGRMEGMLGAPLAALPLPFVVFAWALLPQQVEFLAPTRRWGLAVLFLAAAVVLLTVGWVRSGSDVSHPKLNSITYWLDADSEEARWITVDDSRSGRGTGAQLDEWTRQFFPDGGASVLFNPWVSGWFNAEYPALTAAAPLVPLARSQVRVVGDENTADGGRLLQLQVVPAGDVQDIYMEIQSADGVRLLALNGEEVAGKTAPGVRLNVNGHPRAPVVFSLRVAGAAPVQVFVHDRYLGLPQTAPPITPRPAYMAAAPFTDVSDSTIVAQTVTIR
jgi:hypothetical protein